MRDLVRRNLEVESKNVSVLDVFKQLRYFCLSMIGILLSMCFPAVELQFLVLSIITGAKCAGCERLSRRWQDWEKGD